jgi:hypothetical protein
VWHAFAHRLVQAVKQRKDLSSAECTSLEKVNLLPLCVFATMTEGLTPPPPFSFCKVMEVDKCTIGESFNELLQFCNPVDQLKVQIILCPNTGVFYAGLVFC